MNLPQTHEERFLMDLQRAQEIAFEIGLLETAKAMEKVRDKAKAEIARQQKRMNRG